MELFDYWPQWTRLYWLAGFPVILLLIIAFYKAHKIQSNWHFFLPKAFHSALLTQYNEKKSKRRYWLLGTAWFISLLALLGPNWHTYTKQTSQEQYFAALIIVIQLTPDLLANDLPPSRLHHVQSKVMELLRLRQSAYSSIVVYAGSPHTLVPLSNDLVTSQNLLQALRPDLMPKPGQRADLAIQRAIELLRHGAQGKGQVLLFSTGITSLELNTIEKLLKRQPIALKIIGVGSTAGAPIIEPDSTSNAQQGHFMTDNDGAIVLSRLNEVSLQLLSQRTNSPYTQLRYDASDLNELGLFNSTQNNFTTTLKEQKSTLQDQGYWLVLPVLLLTLLFARRGSLLVLLLCFAPPTQVFALSLNELWLRSDQQAAKLLEHTPKQAAEYFNDLQWRATALYLAEDYIAAANLYEQINTPQAHYNRGNALALAGLLQEAAIAYEQALRQNPELLAAQYNLNLVDKHLKAQKRQTKNEKTATNPSLPTENAAGSITAPTTSQAMDHKNSTPTQNSVTDSLGSPTPVPHIKNSPNESESAPSQLHLERWLEQIPDNPSELLKRKFWYEQSLQENAP